mgnify:FL=1
MGKNRCKLTIFVPLIPFLFKRHIWTNIFWGLCWFHSTLQIMKYLCCSVQLDFDCTAMPWIERRGNSGCDSDGMAVCKH